MCVPRTPPLSPSAQHLDRHCRGYSSASPVSAISLHPDARLPHTHHLLRHLLHHDAISTTTTAPPPQSPITDVGSELGPGPRARDTDGCLISIGDLVRENLLAQQHEEIGDRPCGSRASHRSRRPTLCAASGCSETPLWLPPRSRPSEHQIPKHQIPEHQIPRFISNRVLTGQLGEAPWTPWE